MMAQTFSVSIDYLLYSDDFQNDSFQNASSICSKQKINSLRKFFVPFGIIDVFAFLLFLLPVFANRHDGIKAVALPYLQTSFALTKILLVALVTITVIFGIMQLAFRNTKNKKLTTACNFISLSLSVLLVSLCAAGNYPYACLFKSGSPQKELCFLGKALFFCLTSLYAICKIIAVSCDIIYVKGFSFLSDKEEI